MSSDMRNVRYQYIGDGFMQFFYSGELETMVHDSKKP